ncbi:MAG: exodeoxyribonuclease III [Myxococcales bacterium]
MKLATWNVNSVRAREERVRAWLDANRPDVLCLQETKVEDGAFPLAAFQPQGYHVLTHGQRTYNGVAILSRAEPKDVLRGADLPGGDPQARLLAATLDGVRVVSAYAPNGHAVGSEKFAYKLEWFRRLRALLDERFARGEPLALVGDFNVAPEPRDVYDPEELAQDVLFHPDARAALAQITDFGLVDAFRALHPEPGLYSWWDYRQLAFPKNRGARIDHVLATPVLAARLRSAVIDREQRKGKQPSDHVPVVVELDP